MSKSTIAHGPDFHLYAETFDEDFVHLQLTGANFEASAGEVTVAIPVVVWEVLRQCAAVDLSLAEKSDSELLEIVEAAVEQRIARFMESNQDAKKRRSLIALGGAMLYGAADTAPAEQIAMGMTYYTELRSTQQEVKRSIAALQDLQHVSAGT
jgi:hypothetical protein